MNWHLPVKLIVLKLAVVPEVFLRIPQLADTIHFAFGPRAGVAASRPFPEAKLVRH